MPYLQPDYLYLLYPLFLPLQEEYPPLRAALPGPVHPHPSQGKSVRHRNQPLPAFPAFPAFPYSAAAAEDQAQAASRPGFRQRPAAESGQAGLTAAENRVCRLHIFPVPQERLPWSGSGPSGAGTWPCRWPAPLLWGSGSPIPGAGAGAVPSGVRARPRDGARSDNNTPRLPPRIHLWRGGCCRRGCTAQVPRSPVYN